MAYLIGNIIPL